MAVTTQESTQYANINSSPPTIQDKATLGGRVKVAYFVHDQSGVGDAGSSVAVAKLPAGRVRVLGPMSSLYVNWTAAGADMNVGWDAHTDFGGTAVAADPDGIDSAIDVDAAGYQTLGNALAATGGTKLFESKEGVVIRCTCVQALADGDDVAGYIAYVDD